MTKKRGEKEAIAGANQNPLVLLTTFLGVVLCAVEAITKLVTTLESKWFYLSATALYIGTTFLALRFRLSTVVKTRFSDSRARTVVLVLATLGYVVSVAWPIYEFHIRSTGHAEPTSIKLSCLIEGLALAKEPTQSTLVLESFYVNEDLCSFKEDMEALFAEGDRVRTFAFDMTVRTAFNAGKCVGPTGDKPLEEMVPLLKKRLERSGRQNLVRYIETGRDFSRVERERRDIFDQIIFTSEEALDMMKSAPADFAVVKNWALNCMGIKEPVFTVVVRNRGAQAVLLNAVDYDVLDVGQVKLLVSGPVLPELTYDHPLRHIKGVQHNALKPPLKIAASDTVAFNLRLIPTDRGLGLAWWMRVKIIGSQGEHAETMPFQLIASK